MADDEAAERPVREQLKKASIDAVNAVLPDDLVEANGTSKDDTAKDRTTNSDHSNQDSRPQSQHTTIHTAAKKAHGRKRSRDSAIDDSLPTDKSRPATSDAAPIGKAHKADSHEEPSAVPTLDAPASDKDTTVPLKSPASPCTKRKRVGERDGSSSDEDRKETSRKTSSELKETDRPSTASEPAKPQTAQSTAPAQTSTSAFAASGFGALSGSSSGFGALSGNKPLSSFASTAASSGGKTDKEQSAFSAGKSGFASLAPSSNKSAFGTSSGFGLGAGTSGFGSLGTSKLTSFASASGGDVKPAKKAPAPAFGAPAKNDDDADDDDEAGEDDDDQGDKLTNNHDEKPDERFYERNLETGEEGEETLFTCRAKLYNFVMSDEAGKKEWKERGLGTLRLNMSIPADGDEDAKPKARLVMRADGSHRVILNTPVQKEIKFGDVKGQAPGNGFIYFMGSVDGGKLELLQLKMRQQVATEMYDRVSDVKQQM